MSDFLQNPFHNLTAGYTELTERQHKEAEVDSEQMDWNKIERKETPVELMSKGYEERKKQNEQEEQEN
jgi:hypothetical protein